MTKGTFQIIEMLGRVVAFGQAREDKFPKKSLAGYTLAAIEASIAKAYEFAARQDQRGMRLRTNERKTARDALVAQLEAIHETSVAVGIDQPGTDVFFRMPGYPRRDRALIQAGEAFARHAEPLKQAFVDHSLPEGFIGRLNEAVENLRQAINNQTVARTALSGASTQLSETLNDALTDLQRIDSIVNNTLRDDPGALAEWQVARHVTKARVSKAAAKKPAPTAPPVPSVHPTEGVQLRVK